ncbi:MAG TPA: menaquinone biosynthesis protein [Gemmatimonadales bacterium]|nr:menaquinone biosynthesis protein [Gemmatimonadales bacterium]
MRLGRIGYINCYPVYGAIDRGVVKVSAQLVTGTPAELNDLLVAGELDVSVISAVEYARHSRDLVLLPDVAISSDGPVRSVMLFSRVPATSLSDVPVLLSASSRTSVGLLELLCRDVWKVQPRFAQVRAEAADLTALAGLPHQAVLVIGDPALLLGSTQAYPHVYDLGTEWRRWTGLPFVFAVWAARRGGGGGGGETRAAVARLHAQILKSRDWGLANLDELARSASAATKVPEAECRSYFSGLDYALTDRHLAGLTLFFRKLVGHGLAPEGSLQFLHVA